MLDNIKICVIVLQHCNIEKKGFLMSYIICEEMTVDERNEFLQCLKDGWFPNATLDDCPYYIASSGDIVGYGITPEEAVEDCANNIYSSGNSYYYSESMTLHQLKEVIHELLG